MIVFQFYPVCNFGKCINFELGIVRAERVGGAHTSGHGHVSNQDTGRLDRIPYRQPSIHQQKVQTVPKSWTHVPMLAYEHESFA